MSTLVIIESPGKQKTLSKILGADYVVRASFGHIRDLPASSMGVAAPDYLPAYEISAKRGLFAVDTVIAALHPHYKLCSAFFS